MIPTSNTSFGMELAMCHNRIERMRIAKSVHAILFSLSSLLPSRSLGLKPQIVLSGFVFL